MKLITFADRSGALHVGAVARSGDYVDLRAVDPKLSANMRALFEGGGFAIEQLSVAPLGSRAGAQINVPTVPGGDDYAHLIAARR